jgi:hypothetical protein
MLKGWRLSCFGKRVKLKKRKEKKKREKGKKQQLLRTLSSLSAAQVTSSTWTTTYGRELVGNAAGVGCDDDDVKSGDVGWKTKETKMKKKSLLGAWEGRLVAVARKAHSW